MARYVVIASTKVTGSGYALPDRNLVKGQVLELTAAEVTAIGAGNLRAVAAAAGTGAAGNRDTLGEAFAASNATP
jgi:hypothetical protein